ncbi:glycosyltransferase family 2 protein [Marinomonas sp. NPDC078689]|uniref:glycosyltransferase family 2 protein n=1 Tax=Marinomonas sp. NPDC078689 TaxID=3364147 RepID=UPI0037C5F49C
MPLKENTRLSIVVITWNEKRILERCLKSVERVIDSEKDEVVVVDNGSSDGTADLMKEKFSNMKYKLLKENIGVGPARNVGARMSNGKYVMTLDNDAFFFEECDIGKTIDGIFSTEKNLGVLGFKLLNSDGSFQQSCRRFPGWLQPLSARLSFLRKIKFFDKIHQHHHMDDIDFSCADYPIVVDYVLGANQIFRKSDFLEVGGYDKKIFYGPEDFDFCYRVKIKLNKKTMLSDCLSITHDYQRRTRSFNFLLIVHFLSFYYIMIKHKFKIGLV